MTRSHSRRAFSLVEAVISMVIVAGLVVTALNTAGAAQRNRHKTMQQVQGHQLAQDLLAEILCQPYADSADDGLLGLNLDDIVASNRNGFDDVDDYANYDDDPPTARDGTPLSGFADWRRIVAVQWVNASDFTLLALTDTGVKRVTIDIYCSGERITSISTIRTRAWQFTEENR